MFQEKNHNFTINNNFILFLIAISLPFATCSVSDHLIQFTP